MADATKGSSEHRKVASCCWEGFFSASRGGAWLDESGDDYAAFRDAAAALLFRYEALGGACLVIVLILG